MKGYWIVSVLVSILILGSLGFAQQAFSDGIIDQQNLITTGGLGMVDNAQGFTPTANNLIAVDVGLRPPSTGCTGTWTVNIRETFATVPISIGLASGPIVGTTTHVVDISSTFTQHIHFPSSVPLVPGNPYMLQAISTQNQACVLATDNTNPYPGGKLVFLASTDNDAVFTTYFAESQFVVGGTFLPIDTTALLVVGAYTTASWMIPILVSAVGIGLAVFTLKRR